MLDMIILSFKNVKVCLQNHFTLHALVSKPHHFCGIEHQSQPTDLNEDPFSDPEKFAN